MKNNHLLKSILLWGAVCIIVLAGPLSAFAASSSNPSDKLYFKNKKYYIFNNVWGADQVSGWWQTIYHNSDSDMGWVWNWPSNTSTVKAYPSIVSGWHWTEGYTAGSGFPTRLSDQKTSTRKSAIRSAQTAHTMPHMTFGSTIQTRRAGIRLQPMRL